jgi:hypothetical protein
MFPAGFSAVKVSVRRAREAPGSRHRAAPDPVSPMHATLADGGRNGDDAASGKRSEAMSVLYRDRYVICDEEALTIRFYYFPIGDKRIPYARIRGVKEHQMGIWTGQWRIWGSGDLRHWFHLDPTRPRKRKALIVDKGDWVRAVITPDDPDRVLEILRDRTGKQA